MLELCSIASGSSGNCIMVGDDHTRVLIDAGISGKRIEAGLNEADSTTKDMQGILVTHEHIDHIAGLGVLARKYHIPIYTTRGCANRILNCRSVGNIDTDLFRIITPEEDFAIGTLNWASPRSIPTWMRPSVCPVPMPPSSAHPLICTPHPALQP